MTRDTITHDSRHCLRMRMARLALLSFSLIIVFASCSTTQHVPDGDQLFVGLTKIEYKNYEPSDHFLATQEEIEAALATAPNGALFGSSYYRTPFPYGLWIWNATNGSHGKITKWLNKSFGKAPVLMSQVNPALRASVARSTLHKNGYMHGDVTYTEVAQKNPKKAKIGYTVVMDTLFRVDSMSYQNFPSDVQALIDSTRSEARIAKESPFTVANLDAERTRLSRLLRNNGYYFYNPSYASFLADTFEVPNRVQLRLQMADSLPTNILRKWHVGNMRVNLRHNMREELTDSAGRRFLKIFYHGKHSPIRPRVLLRNMKLRSRQAYSYDNHMLSMQMMNGTGMFSQTDFLFEPRPDTDTLDVQVNLTLDKPYDFYVETNFNGRTIGRMGPEMKVGVTKRNAFRGGEKFDINLHGSYEWETGSGSSGMNTYQYGADGSIEFPCILAPFVGERAPRRDKNGRLIRRKLFYATPWTILKASTDIIRRPGYYKMHIVSGELTYRWQPTESSQHELSPLKLTYQYTNSSTERYQNILVSNPYLLATKSDYFIPKTRYTYTFSSPKTTVSPLRWETSLEQSGNITSLFFLTKGRQWNEKEKTLFETPYSQFVKIETDLTKTWPIDTKSQLVGHINAGHIWNYGNSSSAPFSERFYVGGANSLRAFPVRAIGPGAFPGLGERQASYLMQNGDTRLVLNLEYRRRLFGNLYGAIFLDAGNVWSSDDLTIDIDDTYTEEEQADLEIWNAAVSDVKLRPSKLLNQLATGTGVGLRYDLDFLVLRIDWGFGLHVPYPTGRSGYFNISRFKDMHTLHIAIGYPF